MEHFFKGEKWFTKGKIHYSQYPDYYYGIGSDAPDANKLVYDSNRFIFEAFAVDKKDKTNLRLDYAVGQYGNSGFYVSFGESF